MTRRPHRPDEHDVTGQLHIDWGDATPPASPKPANDAAAPMSPAPAPTLVQPLKWDFRTAFPQPVPEAIEAGVLTEEDAEPENVRSIHDEHAREGLAVLHDLDAVLDVRRRFVDPKTGRTPINHASRERLRQLLEREPARLEHWWRTLMGTYEEAFGPDAADAFGKAIRAWHAGIEVLAEEERTVPLIDTSVPQEKPVLDARESPMTECEPTPPVAPKRRPAKPAHRVAARLPVPRPLPAAIAAGHFGQDEHGPVRPGASEVRAITERHAETIIDLLCGLQQVETWLSAPVCSDPARLYHERDLLLAKVQSAVAKYAEDFGQSAADQLEAYSRRQAKLQETPHSGSRHSR